MFRRPQTEMEMPLTAGRWVHGRHRFYKDGNTNTRRRTKWETWRNNLKGFWETELTLRALPLVWKIFMELVLIRDILFGHSELFIINQRD